MRKLAFLVFYLAIFSVRALSAYALDLSQFTHLIVFGDSLSDNGNSLFLFQQPQPPYGTTFDGTGRTFPGRWTDGQNWVDYFPLVAHHFAPVTAYSRMAGRTSLSVAQYRQIFYNQNLKVFPLKFLPISLPPTDAPLLMTCISFGLARTISLRLSTQVRR